MGTKTHSLPSELVEQITSYLPTADRVSCILTCKTWYSQLYRNLIRNVNLNCRRQLTSFITHLKTYADIGLEVREIYLKPHVGLTPAEFTLIATQCPFLQVFKFCSWQNYKPDSFSSFKELKQIPKLYDEDKAYYAIGELGHGLTHLEISEYLLRKLVPTRRHLLLLSATANLTHLTLDGVFNPDPNRHDIRRMEFDYTDWNLMHEYCPQLIYINMTHANLRATPTQSKAMHLQTSVKPSVKQLTLKSLNLDNPSWLYCLAFMYPNLTLLEIGFDMGSFVNYDETINRLDQVDTQTGFLILAHELKKLTKLILRGLKQSHFPGKLFFNLLSARGTQLEYITVLYDTDNVSLPGMNVQTLNALALGQQKSLKSLEMDMWQGAYEEKFYTLIEPLSLCTQLKRLSLNNDDFTTFNYNTVPLDAILNACPRLIDLSLTRIAVCVLDKHSKKRTHQLKRFDLAVSRVSQQLFEYLTVRCPYITHMTVVTCCWMSREIEMKINMPNNSFEFLRVADMNRRKTVGLEGNLIRGNTVNLFSVTRLDTNEKKKKRYAKSKEIDMVPPKMLLASWYYLYEPPPTRFFFPPSFLRKLRPKEVMTLYYLTEYCKENHHLAKTRPFQEYENRYMSKKNWKLDVASGYVNITCKAIKTLKYNFNVINYK